MKNEVLNILDELVVRYPTLLAVKNDVLNAYLILKKTFENGNKVLVCGNGGSASDSEHIVGELMKKFRKNRSISPLLRQKLYAYGKEGEKLANALEGCLRAISLTGETALSTAFINDKDPDCTFAQRLYGLYDDGDALLCVSTSGNSKNCVLASMLGKALGCKVIALTGKQESKLSALSDVCVKVPETETYKIQELHLPIYHAVCAMLEEEFF